MRCYLTGAQGQGSGGGEGGGEGSRAGVEGAESNTWPPNATAHYVYGVGSGGDV